MSNRSQFADRLRYLRNEKGLTRAELADLAGIDVCNIRHYETGRAEPKLFTAICLADALGVSLDYLATGGE